MTAPDRTVEEALDVLGTVPHTVIGTLTGIHPDAKHADNCPGCMAQDALATVRAELERLRRHPDAWSQEAFDQQKARAEAAEARCARLQQALGESLLSIEEYAEVSGVLIADPEKLRALAGPDTPADSEWFIPEGDRTCGVVHRLARATCMKRRGHDGSHATPQGTWIDGPWCEYPADTPAGEEA